MLYYPGNILLFRTLLSAPLLAALHRYLPERSKGCYPLYQRMNTNAQHQHQEPTRVSLVATQTLRSQHHTPFPQNTPTITSYQHRLIQRIHHLRRREVRDQTGLYYVEGLRFVFQALQHHATLEALTSAAHC